MPYPPYPIKLQSPVSIHVHGGPYDGLITQSCSPVIWAQYPAVDVSNGINLIFPGDGNHTEVHEYWYEMIETTHEDKVRKQMGYRYVGRLKRL